MKERLAPDIFRIPIEEIKSGFYSDSYFLRTREILLKDHYHPRVMVQVFQRQNALLCGIDEAIAIIKNVRITLKILGLKHYMTVMPRAMGNCYDH